MNWPEANMDRISLSTEATGGLAGIETPHPGNLFFVNVWLVGVK